MANDSIDRNGVPFLRIHFGAADAAEDEFPRTRINKIDYVQHISCGFADSPVRLWSYYSQVGFGLKGSSAMHSGSDLDWLLVLALVLHSASPLRPAQFVAMGSAVSPLMKWRRKNRSKTKVR